MTQTFSFIRNYLLLDLVHTGTTSELFRAVEISGQRFQKTVIMKQFLPWVSEYGDLVEQYQALITIHYPKDNNFFVRIIDQGRERGRFFQVRDYIRGQTLGRLIHMSRDRKRPLSIELTLHIISQLCRALHYFEQSSEELPPSCRYHGYINPSTVMVSYEGEVKILNFGLRTLAPLYQNSRVLTTKPDIYRPPGSRAGDVNATNTTDFYSLGTLAFEMVTGIPLFPDEGPPAETDTIPQRLNDYSDRLPKKLLELIVDLTQSDAARRPKTTGQILEELNQLVGPNRRRELAISLKNHVSDVFAREIIDERDKLDADRERYSHQLGLTFEGDDKYLEPTSVIKLRELANMEADSPIREQTLKINTACFQDVPDEDRPPMSAQDVRDYLDQAVKQLLHDHRTTAASQRDTSTEWNSDQDENTDVLRIPKAESSQTSGLKTDNFPDETDKGTTSPGYDRMAGPSRGKKNAQPLKTPSTTSADAEISTFHDENTDTRTSPEIKGTIFDRISLLGPALWFLLLIVAVLLGLVIINV